MNSGDHMKKEKFSLKKAYILWLFGGFLGLHHLYLRRYRHCFVWFCTVGGFCVGWISEIWRLPVYVKMANKDLKKQIWIHTEPYEPSLNPPFDFKRFLGQSLFGLYLSFVFLLGFYNFVNGIFSTVLFIGCNFCIALGVHTVANISPISCHFKYSLQPVLFLSILSIIGATTDLSFLFYGSLFCSINATLRGWKWNMPSESHDSKWKNEFLRKTRPLSKYFQSSDKEDAFYCFVCSFLVIFCCILFFIFLGCSIREHAYLTSNLNDLPSQKVKLKDLDFGMLWKHMTSEFTDFISEVFDDAEERENYKILGLPQDASNEELTSKYRNLALLYHPDRHINAGTEAMKKASEIFITIQQAYRKVIKKRKERIVFT